MKSKNKFMLKNIGIAACILISMSGVAFAGNKIVETIEKIWATPEKIENPTNEITEESKQENITEEEAKEIAIEKFEKLEFSTNVFSGAHYKEINSNKISYQFINSDGYQINIDGQSGKFTSIFSNNITNMQDTSIKMTVDEAKAIAMKYYKLLGLEDEEYELTSIRPDHTVSVGAGGEVEQEEKTGHEIDFIFTKKYGEIYNPFEQITICIRAKDKDFSTIWAQSVQFDNNEIVITKEEAVQIALKEDEKIETDTCVKVDADTAIVMMNTSAYERINNKEMYYEQLKGKLWEEKDYYKIEHKVRNAWIVVITYDIYYTMEGRERYNECQFSYYVDCTTGEIIGGNPGDEIWRAKVDGRKTK